MKRRFDLRCLFGWHRRSASRAWYDGEDMRSICRRCGRPMIRSAEGWQLADPAGDALDEGPSGDSF